MVKKELSALAVESDSTSENSGRRLGGRLIYSGRRRNIVDPHFKRLSRYLAFYYPAREFDHSSYQSQF